MATYNCAACEDIRENAPNLIVNGFGDTECASLQNDTGLNPSSGHNDCTDLDYLNDCLIGNQSEEVEAYEVCEWRDFMKQFADNVWTVLKAIICAICGIWTNIHNLWKLANKIDCVVDYITQGASFSFGEYTDTGSSYIVAGKGVSFANVSASGTSSDIIITYVAGGMAYMTGSCLFYNANFTDAKAVANFDQGGTSIHTSASRLGNTRWNTDGYLGAGGELVYELRIKKSEYPQIARFWNGLARPGAGGNYDAEVSFTDAGHYAAGQRGWCDNSTGDPVGNDSDRGHLVPAGWMYIQMRMKSLQNFNASSSGAQYTPVGLVPIRINQNEIKC